jgi:hypothetical protein
MRHKNLIQINISSHLYDDDFNVFALELFQYWFQSLLLKACLLESNLPKLILSCEISWRGWKLFIFDAKFYLELSSELFWAFRWSTVLFDDEYLLLGTVKNRTKTNDKQMVWVLQCVSKVYSNYNHSLRRKWSLNLVDTFGPPCTHQRFGGTYFLHLQTWRWWQNVPPKRRYISTSSHGVTTHKTTLYKRAL